MSLKGFIRKVSKMKFTLQDILRKQEINIDLFGNEPELELIYQHFPPPASAEKPLLTGKIQIACLTESHITVCGEVSYEPFVTCSRCSFPIRWPIKETLSYTLLEPSIDEKDSPAQENDGSSFFHNGEWHLDEMINDIIVLAVPFQTIRRNPRDESQCLECAKNISGSHVYSSDPEPQTTDNPFHVLELIKTNKSK